ncbi:MAG TPA: SigE family RNA polymerase sigma factor [Actinomycetota bacterium]
MDDGATARARLPKVGRARLIELYQANAAATVRLAYMLTGDRALAEDLSQEAFVRVAGRFRDLQKPEVFRAYLFKAVVNLTRSHWRRERVARGYLQRQNARPPTTTLPDVEGRHVLRDALVALPPRQRAAVVFRYYEDLSERQTADLLGCSVGAVKSLVLRGTEALRRTIGETT